MDNLKLKSIVFDKEDSLTLIGKSTGEVLAYEDPSNLLINIAKYLDGKHSIKEICDNLIKMGFSEDIDSIASIISKVFIAEKLILHSDNSLILSERDLLKYDRILHFFTSFDDIDFLTAQKMQKKLFTANILVLGVGGTGGHTAHALVASGVCNLTLVDHDNVELTNVTRQMLYDETNLGQPKVEAAKKRLQKINPNANINIISQEINSTNDLKSIIANHSYDFIINTMDNPRSKIRYIVDKVLYDTDIPYIFNGSIGSQVIVGPTIKKEKTKSYRELIPFQKLDDTILNLNDENYVTSVIEPMNGAVGQLTAYEVIKYITGCAELATWGRRVKLDMDTLEFDKYGY